MELMDERQRRILRTVTAVAATAGVVLLVRWGVRAAILGHGGDSFDFESVQPPIAPAAKVYDLASLVPKDLSFSVCGMDLDDRVETLPMPIDLAERVKNETAAAAGWTRLDVPETRILAQGAAGLQIWKRPDETLVARRFQPVNGTTSRVCDMELRSDALPDAEAVRPENLFLEAVLRSGTTTWMRLPEVIRPLVGGAVVMTQRIVRGTGTALVVTAIEMSPPATAKARFRHAAAAAGWTPSGMVDGWATLANLGVFVTFTAHEDGSTVAVYRFADDENMDRVSDDDGQGDFL